MHILSLTFLVLVTLLLAGCGSGTSTALVESKRNAQAAYQKALEAWQAKEYEAARDLFAEALQSGTLYADLADQAYVRQAVCLAALGDAQAAHAALDKTESGASNPDEYLAARSFIFGKQGKTRESRSAWNRAKRINRYVENFGN